MPCLPLRPEGSPLRACVLLGGTLLAAVAGFPSQSRSEAVAVEVTNASERVACAEKDNITLNFTSNSVTRFRIEAAHPAYAGSIERDNFEADWTACGGLREAATARAKPLVRRTLYEEPALWVVGWTLPDYWRPATATVRIGDRVETGLHLLQVWMIRPMGGEEVLVVYPQDGYWRLRPLAPTGRAATAFGSSFLIGPVEIDQRPIVRFSEVAFDPVLRTFKLQFAAGGTATLRMTELDQNRHVVDVSFASPISGRPFAALRSMYVTEFNNDVARVAVREADGAGWREEPILNFKSARATQIWAGRTSVSRHNTSSPDLVFETFGAGPPPR